MKLKYRIFRWGKLLAQICSIIMWRQFRYPQSVKGVYNVTGSFYEKLKWAYKCWCRQLETAERGKGIEAFFRSQDLSFDVPENFDIQKRISMAAGGDLMAVDFFLYENTERLFDDIKNFYYMSDVRCANLESTVFDKAPQGRYQQKAVPPKMNISFQMLERLCDGGRGINYVSTANNHCFDYGEEGLIATLDSLDKKGVWHSGTNRSQCDQDDILIINKDGIKIAMLSYTADMNGNIYEKSYLINEVRFNDEMFDDSLIRKHIAKAKQRNVDLIAASIHWGWEFEMYPHKNIIDAGHKLAELGIDLILGSHPHVCQPIEKYTFCKGEIQKEALIIYSLGDFVSYHPLSRNSKITYTVRFDIVKGKYNGDQCTIITNLKILPIYIWVGKINNKKNEYECRLLKLSTIMADDEKAKEYRGKLSNKDSKDLVRLYNLFHTILLPTQYKDILIL